MFEIFFHELLKNLVDLLIIVIRVTLVNNQLVHLHVFNICGDAIRLASKELEQLVHVVFMDKCLALV